MEGSKRCVGGWIAGTLVVVGGLNWGLLGFFDFNLVSYLLGQWPLVETIVYDLVGLAAVFLIIHAFMCRGCCSTQKTM